MVQIRRTRLGSYVSLGASVAIAVSSWSPVAFAFMPMASNTQRHQYPQTAKWASPSVRHDITLSATETLLDSEPQVLASGYSQNIDLLVALQEATEMALQALPTHAESSKIDLAIVTVSSLYSTSPSTVVPTVLEVARGNGHGIRHLIGCTSGGFISSRANLEAPPVTSTPKTSSEDDGEDDTSSYKACQVIEEEGVPGVSVVLSVLPDVKLQTFHVLDSDIPEDYATLSPDGWKSAIGLSNLEEPKDGNTAFLLFPSPAFQNDLDDLLAGMEHTFQDATVFGAVASTVSSLSRARLFRYDETDQNIQTLADGCVGVAMTGDIEIQTMIAQGAKPVGGIYQVVKGVDSTIQSIVLDEAATELVQQAEADMFGDQQEEEIEEEDPESQDTRAQMRATYAKACIPKPVLAEANFLMKTLGDDDQAFMTKAILIGLERGGSAGKSPSDLIRIAEGKGHRFKVRQVASAGVKDGSVTFPLGSVNIEPGTRLRFFVREGEYAKKEVEALWTGHKRKVLEDSTEVDDGKKIAEPFKASGCFVFPTLDRGNKFFLGKGAFETNAVSNLMPSIPSISGFFANGVIGAPDSQDGTRVPSTTEGSSAGYFLLGSKSRRPIYSPAKAAADIAKLEAKKAVEKELAEESQGQAKILADGDKKAPRDENGELVIKRREVHSGRALTVSTVEWSVAEKTAVPTSTLEGYMWDKETEVDRFRERVPLANLVSQWKLANLDADKPRPRDWIGPVKAAAAGGKFVIIPECKKTEPATGSLRKRYNLSKMVKDYTLAGVPAFCVSCDAVLFGGSQEDITTAREASSSAALEMSSSSDKGAEGPPILASDLLLYPYQLYKLRLAGADAVNLVVGALQGKDLLYLTKIASTMQIQTFVTVTSVQQIKALSILSKGGLTGMIVSNRQLEDFSFDMTGQQALDILNSDEMVEFKAKQGEEIPILAEGRVGIIKRSNDAGVESEAAYLDELKQAGALGAIIGGGLALEEELGKSDLLGSLQTS